MQISSVSTTVGNDIILSILPPLYLRKKKSFFPAKATHTTPRIPKTIENKIQFPGMSKKLCSNDKSEIPIVLYLRGIIVTSAVTEGFFVM